MNSVHFQSNKQDWETPDKLFYELHREFKFTLDVCANAINRKLPRFFSPEDDGLSQSWGAGEVCWMNPPYATSRAWIAKAALEASTGATVVALLPARTDTRAFHDHIYQKPNVEIRFLKGRLKFKGAKHAAPFPSMIVVFRPYKRHLDKGEKD